jgi:uncharacterized protein
MLVKLEFGSFAALPGKNVPVIILKEADGRRTMVLPIGPFDASAIALETLKVKPERPFGPQVMRELLEKLGGKLERVLFYLSNERSLTAQLEISARDSVSRIECRPCDAIVLALQCRAPLFAREEALAAFTGDSAQTIIGDLRSHLSALDVLNFGSCYLE